MELVAVVTLTFMSVYLGASTYRFNDRDRGEEMCVRDARRLGVEMEVSPQENLGQVWTVVARFDCYYYIHNGKEGNGIDYNSRLTTHQLPSMHLPFKTSTPHP